MKSYDLSRLRVLLVEQDYFMRMLYRSLLRALGIGNVDVEGGTDQAFDLCRSMKPDIVISDWGPNFDGLGLTKRIRGEGNAVKFMPVIIMSAYTEVERIECARDAGSNRFLAKPFSATTLYERIGATIEDEAPFVATGTYIGPSRRRRRGPFAGNDRRAQASP